MSKALRIEWPLANRQIAKVSFGEAKSNLYLVADDVIKLSC